MKLLAVCLLTIMPFISNAQKVDVDKDDMITVDGVKYAGIKKEGCGMFDAVCQFTVKNLSGKTVLIIKVNAIEGAVPKVPSNPTGRVTYADFIFLESKQKGQLDRFAMKTEKMAKIIVKAGLFADGNLSTEAIDNFILINPVVYGGKVERVITTN